MIKLVSLELFQCITYSIQWIAQNSRFRKDAVSSAFWSVSGNLFQKVGAVLRKYLALSAFCLRSHRTQRWLICTGKKSGENEMDCMGEYVPVNIVAQFYTRTDWYVRERLLY